MSNHELTSIVSSAVGEFYKSRLDKVKNIKLNKILGRKNPYLYQTYGINKPSEFIKKIEDDLEGVKVSSIKTSGASTQFQVNCKGKIDRRADIFSYAVRSKWVVVGMNQKKTDLETIFRKLTSEAK